MTAASTTSEGLALEARILRTIADWAERGAELDDASFEDLALALFAYVVRHNEPYRDFAAAAGFHERHLPESWRAIPAVPSAAFKDATLATFDPANAALAFHTSGTTGAQAGKHFMETATLYEAALLSTFDRFVLGDGLRLRYLHLVPDPRLAPHSSLGYMLGCVDARRGDGGHRFFLRADDLNVDGFAAALQEAIDRSLPVLCSGTAFAFVNVLDALQERVLRVRLPDGSRIVETGGFKGRVRAVERSELYARLSATFGVPENRIIVGSSRVDLQACKLEYSIVSPK